MESKNFEKITLLNFYLHPSLHLVQVLHILAHCNKTKRELLPAFSVL